uniref:Uncharacterized protein n=1 Tax=Tetranychus urticae TaxID=32264 RepID=T1K3M3_TETUR
MWSIVVLFWLQYHLWLRYSAEENNVAVFIQKHNSYLNLINRDEMIYGNKRKNSIAKSIWKCG